MPDDAADPGLAAELAVGADLAGDPGHLVGEVAQLGDHAVDGPGHPEELAAQPLVARAQVDRLGQVAGGDRAEHPADLDGGPDQLVDQVVGGGDGGRPRRRCRAAGAQPLVQPAVPADHPADPVQLAGQVPVALDHLVDHGGQPGHRASRRRRAPAAGPGSRRPGPPSARPAAARPRPRPARRTAAARPGARSAGASGGACLLPSVLLRLPARPLRPPRTGPGGPGRSPVWHACPLVRSGPCRSWSATTSCARRPDTSPTRRPGTAGCCSSRARRGSARPRSSARWSRRPARRPGSRSGGATGRPPRPRSARWPRCCRRCRPACGRRGRPGTRCSPRSPPRWRSRRRPRRTCSWSRTRTGPTRPPST